jgi:hypothetical protein
MFEAGIWCWNSVLDFLAALTGIEPVLHNRQSCVLSRWTTRPIFAPKPRDGLTSCLTTWLREVGSNHRVFRLTVGCLTAWLPRNGILGKCSSDGSFQITVNLRPKNIFRTGGQSRTQTYDVAMTLDLQSSAIAALPSAHMNLERKKSRSSIPRACTLHPEMGAQRLEKHVVSSWHFLTLNQHLAGLGRSSCQYAR